MSSAPRLYSMTAVLAANEQEQGLVKEQTHVISHVVSFISAPQSADVGILDPFYR